MDIDFNSIQFLTFVPLPLLYLKKCDIVDFFSLLIYRRGESQFLIYHMYFDVVFAVGLDFK